MSSKDKFREMAYRANGIPYPPQVRQKGSPRPVRKRWNSLEELGMYLEGFGGRIKSDDSEREGFFVALLEDEQFDLSKCVVRPAVFAEVPLEFAIKVLTLGDFP